jgi:hypothetical protein
MATHSDICELSAFTPALTFSYFPSHTNFDTPLNEELCLLQWKSGHRKWSVVVERHCLPVYHHHCSCYYFARLGLCDGGGRTSTVDPVEFVIIAV